MVRAHWNGAVIAESDNTVVIDGNHYTPAGSVNEEYDLPTIIVFDAHGREIDREIGVPGRRRLEQLVRSASLLAQATTGRGAA